MGPVCAPAVQIQSRCLRPTHDGSFRILYLRPAFSRGPLLGRDEHCERPYSALQAQSYYVLPGISLRGSAPKHRRAPCSHLSESNPFYRLPEVLKDYPNFKHYNRLRCAKAFKVSAPVRSGTEQAEAGFFPGRRASD